MKNELSCSPFLVEGRHLIGDPLNVPLAKTSARRQTVKSSNAAISATAIAAAAAHQVASWHPRDPVNGTASVGKWQYVQVVQRRTRFREMHSLSVSIRDAGNAGKTFPQVRHCIGDFDKRSFSLMNHDDVDFRMVGKKRFGGTGSIVAARHHSLIGIARFNSLCQTKELSCSGLKTQGQSHKVCALRGVRDRRCINWRIIGG